MKSIRAVIAEDEPVLRHELREALGRLWPELVICAEAEDGIEAAHALETHAPDILFLDIEMPGMNGLEVARQASGRCHVAFVTAYEKYAVAAFEEGAIDYVMKPFSPANLDGLLGALGALKESGKEYLRWITVSHGEDLRLITVDEIVYFQADNKYTRVVLFDQETLIRRTIRELVDQLDPAAFWQIHRGTLVSVSAIAGLTRDMGGHLRVKLKQRKETLAVSDPYVHRFRQM